MLNQPEQSKTFITCSETVASNTAVRNKSLIEFTCFGDGEDAGALQISQTVATLAQHDSELVLLVAELVRAVAESAHQATRGVGGRRQLLPPLAGIDAPHKFNLQEKRRGNDGAPLGCWHSPPQQRKEKVTSNCFQQRFDYNYTAV